jgi:hypothetical protein
MGVRVKLFCLFFLSVNFSCLLTIGKDVLNLITTANGRLADGAGTQGESMNSPYLKRGGETKPKADS